MTPTSNKDNPSHSLLKICGITNLEDLFTCAALGVDFVGFNLYQHSKRHVSIDQVVTMWHALETKIKEDPQQYQLPKAVLVTVGPNKQNLLEWKSRFPQGYAIQLHGLDETVSVEDIEDLRRTMRLWKAISVSSPQDIANAINWLAKVDVVLLDSPSLKGTGIVPGGSGVSFEWTLAEQLIGTPRVGVAGGIHPGNVLDIMAFKPFLVDVASGAEHSPGKKSREKIEALIKACRLP